MIKQSTGNPHWLRYWIDIHVCMYCKDKKLTGSVSPSIFRPVNTTPFPSHTYI